MFIYVAEFGRDRGRWYCWKDQLGVGEEHEFCLSKVQGSNNFIHLQSWVWLGLFLAKTRAYHGPVIVVASNGDPNPQPDACAFRIINGLSSVYA